MIDIQLSILSISLASLSSVSASMLSHSSTNIWVYFAVVDLTVARAEGSSHKF